MLWKPKTLLVSTAVGVAVSSLLAFAYEAPTTAATVTPASNRTSTASLVGVVSVPVLPEPPPRNKAVIDRLIECESHGKNVEIVDVNGKWSRGILQFQDSTWADFSRMSGLHGSPLVPTEAIRMADWAISHGYGSRWGCW